MAMLVEYSRKKVVRGFLGGMASRKNLKKWIYLSGKTQRLNWRPLTHTVAYLRPPYVVMRQACHIPPDVVVDCWVSDSENGLHRHFLCRQDVWMTFVCHLSEEITSKISRTWYLPLHSVEPGTFHAVENARHRSFATFSDKTQPRLDPLHRLPGQYSSTVSHWQVSCS